MYFTLIKWPALIRIQQFIHTSRNLGETRLWEPGKLRGFRGFELWPSGLTRKIYQAPPPPVNGLKSSVKTLIYQVFCMYNSSYGYYFKDSIIRKVLTNVNKMRRQLNKEASGKIKTVFWKSLCRHDKYYMLARNYLVAKNHFISEQLILDSAS